MIKVVDAKIKASLIDTRNISLSEFLFLIHDININTYTNGNKRFKISKT
jgi:hypothetical protein